MKSLPWPAWTLQGDFGAKPFRSFPDDSQPDAHSTGIACRRAAIKRIENRFVKSFGNSNSIVPHVNLANAVSGTE